MAKLTLDFSEAVKILRENGFTAPIADKVIVAHSRGDEKWINSSYNVWMNKYMELIEEHAKPGASLNFNVSYSIEI